MDFAIETIEERPVLGITEFVTLKTIGNKIGELIGRVMPVAGPHMAGPILSRYHTWENDEGDMEVAVPVRAPMADQGEVKASTLPGGPAVVCLHVGPYDDLADSWRAIKTWVEQNGKVSRAPPWEEYLDDPGVVPQAECRTRIVWPIE